MSTMLSAAILAGFTLVAILPEGSLKERARLYVDPALVIIVSLIALPAPLSMLRAMARELFDMSPAPEIAEPVEATTRHVLARHGVPDPFLRMTKTGGRLYLEVDHVVATGTWTADQVDLVRGDIITAVHTDAYSTWLNLDISTNPTWSES